MVFEASRRLDGRAVAGEEAAAAAGFAAAVAVLRVPATPGLAGLEATPTLPVPRAAGTDAAVLGAAPRPTGVLPLMWSLIVTVTKTKTNKHRQTR